jgi:hypothetical protein
VTNLMKPREYREIYTVMGNTPYQVEEDSLKGLSSDGGVLRKGRIVWVEKRLGKQSPQTLISAYAEEIGLISLDPRFLIAGF